MDELFSSEFNDKHHIFKSPNLVHIIREAVVFFSNTPDHSLPPTERFIGAGVYGLYYRGAFPPYNPLERLNHAACHQPIYIGKATPLGSRAARQNVSTASELHNRLNEHTRSIEVAQNLELADFRCRFMILHAPESDMIGAIESALIRHYRPLWNVSIDGFGNHDPGSGRYNQSPSHWDILHPGRTWAARLTGNAPTLELVLERVHHHLTSAS